jgi:hypothetical protein
MKLKEGVKLTNLTPQMALGCFIVAGVMKRLDPTCSAMITSVDDSKHGSPTLHGKGRAADWRTKDFNGDKYQLRNEVKSALGDEFDVVLEDLHGPNEHMHTEHDPR